MGDALETVMTWIVEQMTAPFKNLPGETPAARQENARRMNRMMMLGLPVGVQGQGR